MLLWTNKTNIHNFWLNNSNATLSGAMVYALMLTLKVPRKPASENVVCLCRLLNILANFSNLFLQTVWTQIRLLGAV